MELLYNFAKEQGIKSEVVDDFIKKESKVTTFEELAKLDSSLLTHYSYISDVPAIIKSFINNCVWTERYRTIDLDEIIDILNDKLDFYDFGEVIPFEESEHNRTYQPIIQALIDSKFGSVVYDW